MDTNELVDNVNKSGNGHKPVLHDDDLEGSFHLPSQQDNTRLLLEKGLDLDELAMRSDLPNMAFLACWASVVQKCEDYSYDSGKSYCRTLIAALPGVRAKRAVLYSNTIIGERSLTTHKSAFNRFKDWAFGGNEQ